MENIRKEIKQKLGVEIMREVEADHAIGFEIRMNNKRYNFYSLKDENFRENLLLFNYRVKKSSR